MRIAVFTNNYLPNPYGVAKSVESFRLQFEKMGHTVYIFAPLWKGYQDSNTNIFRYPSWDFRYRIRFPLAIPFSKEVDNAIKKLDFDIIHSQHPNLLGMIAVYWASKKRVPLVFTWHTLYDKYTNYVPVIPEKLVAWWAIRSARRYANRAEAVVVPTSSIEPIIRRWGVVNESVRIIPTGVEEEKFGSRDRNKVRLQYGIGEEKILLLCVTRLTEEKNVSFLLEAIAPVLREYREAKFMLVGGGYLKNELKNKISKLGLAGRVIFTGEIKLGLKHYYAAADIFVYASKSETQGMILTEAMYCGLPIVALRATGACDLIRNGESGFLTEETVGDFSGKVNQLIADNDLRSRFGQRAREIALAEYTDKVCAEKMLGLYEEVIEKGKGNL